MNRSRFVFLAGRSLGGLLVSSFCLSLCVSCTSSPSGSASPHVAKYGAGSVDSPGSSNTSKSDKAAAPPAIQKVRTEEILAQVVMHETDMNQALAARKYAAAISSFDAISDLITGIPAGLGRLNDDRAKIETALDSVRFEALSIPSETMTGTAFKKDFSIRVYTLEGDIKRPLPGLECTVSCPAGTETRTSSEDGLVTYTAPVPVKSGKNLLVMAAALTSKENTLRDSIALRMEKGWLALSFPHIVYSNARNFSTTISILDFDQNGKPIQSNVSATTLLKPLIQKGFHRIGMADFTTELAGGDDAVILKAAKVLFGGGVQRLIYGTVKIENAVQGDDGQWTCFAVGRVSVHDFTSDQTVYTTTLSVAGTAKSEAGAIDSARMKLAGELLPQDLYYNM